MTAFVLRATKRVWAGRACAILWLALLLLAGPNQTATAQSENALRWDNVATRAETLLNAERPTDTQLETLREDLSRQRGEALAVQGNARDRLSALEAQLNALGPAPSDGEVESAEIAARRDVLMTQIAGVKTPVLEAEESYLRADRLIDEIDSMLRARQSERMLRRGPSPANPVHWAAAGSQLAALSQKIRQSYAVMIAAEGGTILRQALPLAVLLFAVGIAILTIVRTRAVQLVARLLERSTRSSSRAGYSFVLNFVRIAIPAIAAIPIVVALFQITPEGVAMSAIRDGIIGGILLLIIAQWLAYSLFAPNALDTAVLPRVETVARRGWRMTMLLGIVVALRGVTESLSGANLINEAAAAVIAFPVTILGAFGLVRLAGVIRDVDDADGQSGQSQSNLLLSRLMVAVAIVAPVFAVLGYANLAGFFLGPTILSLGLIGALLIVFAVFRDSLEQWLDGSGDEARRSARARFRLLPVLIGFALICVAIPVLTLIWGGRVTDLEEIWIWLRDGIAIGDARLSMTDFLSFVLIFVIGYTLTRMLQAVIRNSVLPRTDIDVGGRNAILTGVGYLGIFLSAVAAISSTGLNLSNLAIVAGALSVGIGFGLQTIVSNFVSGIILLIERPIKEGDWIEVAGYSGYVKGISVRSTEIETFDKASVIVPNAELIAGSVLNWTHTNMSGRVIVPVGVAYGSDPKLVAKILGEIANDHPMVLRTPPPGVVFMGFGADSMDFEIRAQLRDVNFMLSAKSEMNFEIVERFEAAGIEIPFAQRDVRIRDMDELATLLDKLGKGRT